MKKILVIIASLLFIGDVNALTINGIEFEEKECSQSTVETGKKELQNVSYTLTYVPDATDMEGNALIGYFNMEIVNLPNGYEAKIFKDEFSTKTIDDYSKSTLLKGGVYSIEFYNNSCSTPIKKMDVFIPLYKNFCYNDNECEKDPWFDGTYEKQTIIDKKEQEEKVNKILLVVLLVLILIIVIFVFIAIKRRKDNEKSL